MADGLPADCQDSQRRASRPSAVGGHRVDEVMRELVAGAEELSITQLTSWREIET